MSLFNPYNDYDKTLTIGVKTQIVLTEWQEGLFKYLHLNMNISYINFYGEYL